MSKEAPSDQTVEKTDSEEATVMVADPEDYQKTKKLKSIYEAKNHVSELKRNRADRIAELSNTFRRKGLDVYSSELSGAVADYGNELLPLIEEGLDKGVIEDDDLDVSIPSGDSEIPLIEFILLDGDVRDGEEETRQITSMAVFRQLQRIQRKLGLGLDLEEEQTPAEI